MNDLLDKEENYVVSIGKAKLVGNIVFDVVTDFPAEILIEEILVTEPDAVL